MIIFRHPFQRPQRHLEPDLGYFQRSGQPVSPTKTFSTIVEIVNNLSPKHHIFSYQEEPDLPFTIVKSWPPVTIPEPLKNPLPHLRASTMVYQAPNNVIAGIIYHDNEQIQFHPPSDQNTPPSLSIITPKTSQPSPSPPPHHPHQSSSPSSSPQPVDSLPPSPPDSSTP